MSQWKWECPHCNKVSSPVWCHIGLYYECHECFMAFREEDLPHKLFHGYRVQNNGRVLGKKDKYLTTVKRDRRGGGFDICIRLHYGGKTHKWTLSRLIISCFQGPVHGYEANHKDRDPENNNNYNVERLTPSQNQKHWREDERRKTK